MSNGKTNRRKGHDAERFYANRFKEVGFTFCTTARLGSRLYDNAKIDLINLPFNVQIKAGIQQNLNPGKELFNMSNMIIALFPPEDDVHNKPRILIHRKQVGRGNKRLPEDDIVYISRDQFFAFKEQIKDLRYLFEKNFKYEFNSEFKKVVAITYEDFEKKIIKKIFKKDGNNKANK